MILHCEMLINWFIVYIISYRCQHNGQTLKKADLVRLKLTTKSFTSIYAFTLLLSYHSMQNWQSDQSTTICGVKYNVPTVLFRWYNSMSIIPYSINHNYIMIFIWKKDFVINIADPFYFKTTNGILFLVEALCF